MNVAALVAVPPGEVTEIVPVVAPVGTTAVIEVSEVTVKLVACVPLKDTLPVPVKLWPVRLTVVPTGPDDGEIEVRVVVGITVKVAELGPMAPGDQIQIWPVVAPVGTVVVIVVELTIVNGELGPV